MVVEVFVVVVEVFVVEVLADFEVVVVDFEVVVVDFVVVVVATEPVQPSGNGEIPTHLDPLPLVRFIPEKLNPEHAAQRM